MNQAQYYLSTLALCTFAQAGIAMEETQSLLLTERTNLAEQTSGKGFGPQSPRNIDNALGHNDVAFNKAPAHTDMNLCNIHFHRNAEHQGGEFNTFVGYNGDAYNTGFKYSGQLTEAERAPVAASICPTKKGGLKPGDTIEVHFVHSSAAVKPGPTLGACLNDATKNPQLRVESQVFVLVNDETAPDFRDVAYVEEVQGKSQALNIPRTSGKPIEYLGSTTGPKYNEKGSPFQVTWAVRPGIMKVNAVSVGAWCQNNIFNEDHAHGVRNLVTNPTLLSTIE